MIPLLNLFITSPPSVPLDLQVALPAADASFAEVFTKLDNVPQAASLPAEFPAELPLPSAAPPMEDEADPVSGDPALPLVAAPALPWPPQPLETIAAKALEGDPAPTAPDTFAPVSITPSSNPPATLPESFIVAALPSAPTVALVAKHEMDAGIPNVSQHEGVAWPSKMGLQGQPNVDADPLAEPLPHPALTPVLMPDLATPEVPASLDRPMQARAKLHDQSVTQMRIEATTAPREHSNMATVLLPAQQYDRPQATPVPPASNVASALRLRPTSVIEATFRSEAPAQVPTPSTQYPSPPEVPPKLVNDQYSPMPVVDREFCEVPAAPVLLPVERIFGTLQRPAVLDVPLLKTSGLKSPPPEVDSAILEPPKFEPVGFGSPEVESQVSADEKLDKICGPTAPDPQKSTAPLPKDPALPQQVFLGVVTEAMPVTTPPPREVPPHNPVANQPMQPLPATAQGPLATTLVSLAREGTSDRIEVTLAPEELGKLRMSMVADGDVMRVHLVVERPETLDLLRKHADQMVAEFRQAGYAGASLSFGNWGGDNGAESRRPPVPQQHSNLMLPTQDIPTQVTNFATGGLDLRL